jgi:hypothetical protein
MLDKRMQQGDSVLKKNVLIISASFRRQSNSAALADAFRRGAESAGHSAELASLSSHTIAFCRGCLACQSLGRCVIDDDANAIADKVKNADVVVFATPIYYYEMSGQLKTLLDRCNPIYAGDYSFRDIYFLSTAADDAPDADARAIQGLQGWICCFDKCRLAGTVFAGGVNDPGDIAGHPALKTAFDLGAAI